MALEISPQKTRIGFIGTGVMGRSMCGHLLAAGYKTTVFSRTKEKAAELIDRGATWVASPREVAAASNVIISIVGFPSDVRQVLLGENGALAGCKAGNVIVDMTTSEPSLAVEIAEQAKKRGVISIDAPVSGGDVGARNATLSIMIGGDADTVVTHFKPNLAGRHLKSHPRLAGTRMAYDVGQCLLNDAVCRELDDLRWGRRGT